MSNHKSTTSSFILVFSMLTVVSSSVGCGYVRQAREDAQPNAVREMRVAQTLNPDASKNHKVVAGLDGTAASKVNESYTKTFDRKAPTSAVDTFAGLSGLSN